MQTLLNNTWYTVEEIFDDGSAILALDAEPLLKWRVKKITRDGKSPLLLMENLNALVG